MTGIQRVRETLARHRDKPAIGLDITFPINWQMDADLGAAIQADLGMHGHWERRRATPSLGDHIPARTGVYMFVFRSHLELTMANGPKHCPTWVFYVGRAGNASSSRTLKDRYKGEYSKFIGGELDQLWSPDVPRGRDAILQRYLSIWPLDYWWLVVEDRAKIEHLEDRLIKLFAPPLNRLGQLRVKTGEPKPAFRIPK